LAGRQTLQYSHGRFSRVVAAQSIGLPVIEAQHFALGTASLGILSVGPAHPEVRVIELWNAAPAVLAGAR
jgi:probable phosphoglycerate mutase